MRRRVFYSLGDTYEDRDAFIFEVDEVQYGMIVGNLMREGVDLDDALDKALAMLSANVRMAGHEIDDDVLKAQAVATATVWFLFNEAADEEDRVAGDVLLVEKDGDLFVADLEGAPDVGTDDDEA